MRLAEKFLYHIWDAQHLRKHLQTVSGKEITVKFHGQWNTGKGADFKNAILQIEGETVQGDVEIHFESYDWIAHRHQENVNFNSVVLHVVFMHQQKVPYTIKENGEKCEILEMKNVLDEDIRKLLAIYENKDFSETEHLCDFFSGLDKPQTLQCLVHFGQERFQKKIKRFTAQLEFSDFNQLLYQGIMESAGYSKNKFQMLQLAQNISYQTLQNWFSAGMTRQEMISIILGTTGLLAKLPATFSRDIAAKWQEIFSTQNYCHENYPISWNFFRIRPQNHPAVRIVQLTKVFYDSFSESLQQRIVSLFSYPKENFSMSLFRQRFYAFFQQITPMIPEPYCLGKKRLDVILINIILPIIMLYAEQNKFEDLKNAVQNIYLEYPGLLSNSIITHMETGMENFQTKMTRRSAVLQQGVMELYYAYCEYRMCEMCRIVKNKLIEKM